MKFGQLTKYNMKNIFVEKSYAKYGGKEAGGVGVGWGLVGKTTCLPTMVVASCDLFERVNTSASIRKTHFRSFHKMYIYLKFGERRGITRQSFHNFVLILFTNVLIR